jgi:REP element-mobilizing transposase RayT
MLDAIPPRAYLITFRTYGTWLHGDERGSVDRFHKEFATPLLAARPRREAFERRLMRHDPVRLDTPRRRAVARAIRETCEIRGWTLLALNVRTNHVHMVVSAPCPPERVLNALKANATRSMRESGCWPLEHSPWSRGGSTKYLWTDQDVAAAVDYVLHRQGPALPS